MSSWSEKVGEVEAKMGLVSIPNTPRCDRCKYYDDYDAVCLLLVRIFKNTPAIAGHILSPQLTRCRRFRADV